jgi:glutaredoxin
MKKTAILILLLLVIACSSAGRYDSFAQCLSEKRAVMYGTQWCSHCRNQKAMFGDSFKYIIYSDCDTNKEACEIAGVNSYPTWIINNNKYTGEQDLSKLASLTGCELPKN